MNKGPGIVYYIYRSINTWKISSRPCMHHTHAVQLYIYRTTRAVQVRGVYLNRKGVNTFFQRNILQVNVLCCWNKIKHSPWNNFLFWGKYENSAEFNYFNHDVMLSYSTVNTFETVSEKLPIFIKTKNMWKFKHSHNSIVSLK